MSRLQTKHDHSQGPVGRGILPRSVRAFFRGGDDMGLFTPGKELLDGKTADGRPLPGLRGIAVDLPADICDEIERAVMDSGGVIGIRAARDVVRKEAQRMIAELIRGNVRKILLRDRGCLVKLPETKFLSLVTPLRLEDDL